MKNKENITMNMSRKEVVIQLTKLVLALTIIFELGIIIWQNTKC